MITNNYVQIWYTKTTFYYIRVLQSRKRQLLSIRVMWAFNFANFDYGLYVLIFSWSSFFFILLFSESYHTKSLDFNTFTIKDKPTTKLGTKPVNDKLIIDTRIEHLYLHQTRVSSTRNSSWIAVILPRTNEGFVYMHIKQFTEINISLNCFAVILCLRKCMIIRYRFPHWWRSHRGQ